jgi:NAD(P)-dependent dehydrogenase (short-subunit alcohol dehydrogenase family)
MADGSVVIVGGTSGLGRQLASRYAGEGRDVVITGRDQARTESVAAELGGNVRAIALDLAEPHGIPERLADIGRVERAVLSAIDRDANTVRDYDIDRAIRLVTLKVVGYTAVVHALAPQMHERSSIVLFGGLAKERPYAGSTTVTSINGAVTHMVYTFAIELAPIRVNGIHPGIVGDSPAWEEKDQVLDAVREQTLTGRLITMDEVADAAHFLLENGAVNGINLNVDGGWLLG